MSEFKEKVREIHWKRLEADLAKVVFDFCLTAMFIMFVTVVLSFL